MFGFVTKKCQIIFGFVTKVYSKLYIYRLLCFLFEDEENATAEVDFVISFQTNLIPIEVKSGYKGTLKSLHLFMANANHDIAIRISSMPYSKETIQLENKTYQLYNIPFYGISQIEKVLQKAAN